MLSESSYGRIWQQARAKALTAAQVNSPLAERPYDVRHIGVTLQLNAGGPREGTTDTSHGEPETIFTLVKGTFIGGGRCWVRTNVG